MIKLHPEYIVDENLNRKSVVLPYAEWKSIVEEIEELEDIRAYDRAKNETEVGDYRVIYEITELELVILIVHIGHRSQVYKTKG